LVVAEFCSLYSSRCHLVAQEVKSMATSEFPDVKFLYINIDKKNENLGLEHEVEHFPTFILFKNGRRVQTVVGAKVLEVKRAIRELM